MKATAKRTKKYTDLNDYCVCCNSVVDYSAGGTTSEDGEAYCVECTTAMSQVCTVCGELLPIWEMAHVTDSGAPYCENCAGSI